MSAKAAKRAVPKAAREAFPDMPELGEVYVRGPNIREFLELHREVSELIEQHGAKRVIERFLPRLLSLLVVDADGAAIYSEDDWAQYGGAYKTQTIALFNRAWALADFKGEGAAKKSEASPS